MFKFFKQPEIPSSSPDMLTFPFEYNTFSFTMENYVKSYTRNRVTKENLKEILDEVNSALKTDSDSFKAWDYFAVFLMLALNGGILACVLTIEMRAFVMFAIKLGYIVVALIMNFVLYGCCLDSTVNRLRDKIQSILDQKDEYFDSKGMKWTVCNGADFPYWVELHIQSQFEMKLEREIEQATGGKKNKKTDRDNENKGILDSVGNIKYPPKKGGLFANKKNTQQHLIGFEVDEEAEEYEQDQSHVQPKPRGQRNNFNNNNNNNYAQQQDQPRDDVEIEVKDKKFDRLYAPLEEDYEENYEEDEQYEA